MTAIRVSKQYFSGLSRVHDAGASGLAAAIRGLAIQQARLSFSTSAPSSFTDNSTGTATALIAADIPIPLSKTATASLGAQTAALITSLGKHANAFAVMAATINKARGRLGLPRLAAPEGTVASANTIPAQDTAATTASVGSTADSAGAIASMLAVKGNLHALVVAHNEVMKALGMPKMTNGITISYPSDTALQLLHASLITSSSDGTKSVLAADVTAFLAAVANAIASIALSYNTYVDATISSLTDSSGGSPASALAADAIPAAATGAATTSAPKAGFDTQLGVIKNAISSIAACYNQLAEVQNFPLISDGTGGTVSTTLAAISASLTAVDGSSGTVAVDVVSATARMTVVRNSLSSLGVYINGAASSLDVDPLGTDALGGAKSSVLAPLTSTATGVSGVNATMLKTAVDTWLAGVKNNIASLAATLNAAATAANLLPMLTIAG